MHPPRASSVATRTPSMCWSARSQPWRSPDAHPLSPGHTLIIPRRHVRSVFELSTDEYEDVWRLVRRVRELLSRRYEPAGMTVGCNDGEAAGQTVEHAHVHVIPRYRGDVEDPRGGIRWVIPHQAPYWTTANRPRGR